MTFTAIDFETDAVWVGKEYGVAATAVLHAAFFGAVDTRTIAPDTARAKPFSPVVNLFPTSSVQRNVMEGTIFRPGIAARERLAGCEELKGMVFLSIHTDEGNPRAAQSVYGGNFAAK